MHVRMHVQLTLGDQHVTVTTLERPLTREETAVASGARWLDEHYPRWDSRIDLDILDMGDDEDCILGQVSVSRSYDIAMEAHGLDHVADGVELGFYMTEGIDCEKNWAPLHHAWRTETERRRQASER